MAFPKTHPPQSAKGAEKDPLSLRTQPAAMAQELDSPSPCLDSPWRELRILYFDFNGGEVTKRHHLKGGALGRTRELASQDELELASHAVVSPGGDWDSPRNMLGIFRAWVRSHCFPNQTI